MAELQRETKFDLDISAAITVLTYAYTGVLPREVIARVNIGDADGPLGGTGGIYTLLFLLNGVEIMPISNITVPAARLETIMISRPIPIEQGDTVEVQVTGRGDDTSVNTVATLRDVTAAKISDLTGSGEVSEDHDYGGDDALQITNPDGVAIDNAVVRAYLKSDYDAGNRGPDYVKGETRTNVSGRWERPMMLDPGAYTTLAFRQSDYAPTATEITVT